MTVKSQQGCNGGPKNDVSPNAAIRKATDKTKAQECKKFQAGQPCAYTDGNGRCPFLHSSVTKKIHFDKYAEVSSEVTEDN